MSEVKNNVKGILLIDKNQDWTSHDCISVLRRKLGVKKIGHTGTLDPMATGLLVVCIGDATRLIQYLEEDRKTYEGSLVFGFETDTEDVWGDVIGTSIIPKNLEFLAQEKLKEFLGEQSQIPPMYSAIKIKGKKLYEYARSGKCVDIKARPINVDEFILSNFRWEDVKIGKNSINTYKAPVMNFKLKVSKGTYIRSLCRDLGKSIGCGATMASLRRTETGKFKLPSLTIEEIKSMDVEELKKNILPSNNVIMNMKKIELTEEEGVFFSQGRRIRYENLKSFGKVNLDEGFRYQGVFQEELIGVLRYENGVLKPEKILKK